jgi:hypothetical protein
MLLSDRDERGGRKGCTINDMKHFEKNPRKISEKQAADLLYNLEVYGDLSGIVENKRTGEAIGGNQRSEVMRLIQDKVKPVIEHRYKRKTKQGTIATGYFLWQGERYSYRLVDWDADTARAANVIANHAGGEWDWSILHETLSKEDLLSYGFTQKELTAEGWEFGETKDAEPQIDRAAELQKKWKVKDGDLWQLGKHKLLCGDCTVRENVERLMKKMLYCKACGRYHYAKEV